MGWMKIRVVKKWRSFSLLAFNPCMALSQKVTITTAVRTSNPIMEDYSQHRYYSRFNSCFHFLAASAMLWWTSSLTSNIHLQNGVQGRMLILPDLRKHKDNASHQSLHLGECVLNTEVQFPFYGVITMKPWRYFKMCKFWYKRAM
jgi:hypothetical protein